VKRVYYQRLQIPINELENKKQFKCLWISHNFRDEKELVLYPNRSVVFLFLLMDWLGKVVACVPDPDPVSFRGSWIR
jgi:ubiquitin carboxyl-terminal hydrolase 7